jgi:hypothetical protein
VLHTLEELRIDCATSPEPALILSRRPMGKDHKPPSVVVIGMSFSRTKT